MKLITAYVHPFMAEKVIDALRNARVHGVTVLACQGFGRMSEGQAPHYLDEEAQLGLADETKIELVCADAAVEQMINVIRESAKTGHHGDGKIFVSSVDIAVDIRTGNRGEDVL